VTVHENFAPKPEGDAVGGGARRALRLRILGEISALRRALAILRKGGIVLISAGGPDRYLRFADCWARLLRGNLQPVAAGSSQKNHLIGRLDAQGFGARAEAGYRLGSPAIGVTPYAAGQAQAFHTPQYAETDALRVVSE
jgi:hypothetical protein